MPKSSTDRPEDGEPQLNPIALEAARKAVEAVLVEFRDARISVFGGNGFVIKERDGKDSHILRLLTRDGLEIGIRAFLSVSRAGPGPK